MGEPVKILNLARDMIKLSGLSESDIQIKFIGLRPGEKLYEELLADGEYSLATSHQKVRVANSRQIDADKIADLLSWIELSPNRDENKLKKELSQWVEGYTPEFNVVEKNNF